MVAIAFDEPEAVRLVGNLDSFERLLSSNLLEAEFESALVREGVSDVGPDYLCAISWVFPSRPLTAEVKKRWFEAAIFGGPISGTWRAPSLCRRIQDRSAF